MLSKEEFEFTRSKALDALNQKLCDLRALKCPDRIMHLPGFNLKELSQQSITQLLKAVPSSQMDGVDYVYVIRAQSADADKVRRLAELLKRERHKYPGVSRIIEPCPQASHTLYVGRSKKLRQRLKQHLGRLNSNAKSPTYALWLRSWAAEYDLGLSVSYMRFEGLEHSLVQTVEDGLWTALCPLFGRQGDK